jgi:hypothetical protein
MCQRWTLASPARRTGIDTPEIRTNVPNFDAYMSAIIDSYGGYGVASGPSRTETET